MTTDSRNAHNDEREYSLSELSELAGVSPRTVRYYIVEELLPPPLTSGRNASYGQEHLDRLHAIATMKEMYLPLREIGQRLDALTPGQMRDPAYLASLSQAVGMSRAGQRHGHRGHQQAERAVSRRQRTGNQSTPQRLPAPPGETWNRIPLGDDAELLIRSRTASAIGTKLHRALDNLRDLIETEERNSS